MSLRWHPSLFAAIDRETINTSYWTSPSGSVLACWAVFKWRQTLSLKCFVSIQTDLILTNSLFTKCVPVIMESLLPAFSGTSLKMIEKKTKKWRDKTYHSTNWDTWRENNPLCVFLDLISNQVSRHAKEPREKTLKWTFLGYCFHPKETNLNAVFQKLYSRNYICSHLKMVIFIPWGLWIITVERSVDVNTDFELGALTPDWVKKLLSLPGIMICHGEPNDLCVGVCQLL